MKFPEKLAIIMVLGVCAASGAQAADRQSGAAEEASFRQWLAVVRKDAESQGIQKTTLDTALARIELLPQVVELDKKQPEHTITFREYISRVVTQARIRHGKQLLQANKDLLQGIADKYGVPPRFIVALWGIETDFGHHSGGFYVPSALATLGFEGRRADFFRSELLKSLQILDEGHIRPQQMKGSWAGAMGQIQFMPSSFLQFAEDYNGDSKRDIWTNKADFLASIANYLAKSGWDAEQTWGRKIQLPKGFDVKLADASISKTIKEWQEMGVRREDGSDLPVKGGLSGSVILPGGADEEAYLVYDNFAVLMKWNRSQYFACAVGKLADALE